MTKITTGQYDRVVVSSYVLHDTMLLLLLLLLQVSSSVHASKKESGKLPRPFDDVRRFFEARLHSTGSET